MLLKKLVRIFIVVLVLSLLALVLFFIWASSANYSKNDYSQLIENQYPASVDNDSIYSIVTYNMGYLSGMTNNKPVSRPKSLFENNLKHVYQEFENLNADILCFQELDYHSKRSFYINQQEALQKLGYNYVFQAINWDKKYLPFPYLPISAHFGEIYSGQSILSKYPIIDTERIVLDRVSTNAFYRNAFYIDRLAQVSIISLNGRPVVVINVHLEAADKNTRVKQTKFIAQLYKKFKDDFPVLLVGDFNSDKDFDNAAINILLNHPELRSSCIGAHSYEATFPSIRPTKRLDYIFYNPNFIEWKRSKVLTAFGQASDHLPVYMEFKLK